MKVPKALQILPWIVLMVPVAGWSLSPVHQYFDLVAGEGEPGYRDGDFVDALFNDPLGLAFNDDGTKIYVADSGNNRIRMIDLSDHDWVSTVAGSGQGVENDGSANQASFYTPCKLTMLPGGKLLVYDYRGESFRLVDLSTGRVTTFLDDRISGDIHLGSVDSVLYNPADGFVYFTQSGFQVLRRIKPDGSRAQVFTMDKTLVPRPYVLALDQGKLCLSDQVTSAVYRVDSLPDTSVADSGISLTLIAQGDHIRAMAESNGILYAFQSGDVPWVRLTANNQFDKGEVKFVSIWGQSLEPKSNELQSFLNFGEPFSPFLVAFPGEPQRFLWAGHNQIFSMKDYQFYEYLATKTDEPQVQEKANGLTDFTYPRVKPKGTFRILILGDSRVFYESEAEVNRWPWPFDRMETFPKKLETALNMEAALDDVPIHFEVLTLASYRWAAPLTIWPCFRAPQCVKDFDVDEVLWFMPNDLDTDSWFQKPYTRDGLPDINVMDNEFALKPMEVRLAGQSVVQDLYNRCRELKWVQRDHWDLPRLEELVTDSQAKEDILNMITKSFTLTQQKLEGAAQNLGHPVSLHLLFVPLGSMGALDVPVEPYRDFYREVCRRSNIDFQDLTAPWTALKISAYPTTEFWGMHHFDHNGHTLLAFLISHLLIKEHLIPFETANNAGLNSKP